ncbi:DUF7344 domain-containing protein [Halomicrococcus sp. NG-SE-24]|uniref:DUF7344 domain-containing protein n=1 Tax=Halomicrococcus sp. NG-SE-24 TaxID=3436928 RepID=UPI003D9A0A30
MNSHEEKIIRVLSDATNRKILSIFNEAPHDLSVAEIAEQLISHNMITSRSAEYEDRFDQACLSLHHNHLPRLDDAGLITYDPESNTVRSTKSASVDAEWDEMEAIAELLSQFQTGSGTGESTIGVLEGKEDVYEYGRELADKAEDELFLVYASDDLLDEDCLPHANNAIDRGVEFYAGAKSHDTRRFFQECLPEATVWEPQLDWMNDQSSYPKVSRLIFADRNNVVVGLWDDSCPGESKREIAMIGEGANNPLVVLVRELLGPRLDHLDYQSENFLEELPFET